MIIRRVLRHKSGNYLWVTIPKNSGIQQGDYIAIKKIEERFDDGKETD